MQGYCDIFLRIILKRTLTEANVYMRRHQGTRDKHFDVSNVIYHKFSHGSVSDTLYGENVNIVLELVFLPLLFLPKRQNRSICQAMTGKSAFVITWLISRAGFQVTLNEKIAEK